MRLLRRRQNRFTETVMRPRVLVPLGTTLLVALVAVVVVPRIGRHVIAEFRPTAGPGESLGLDVSHHQGTIDWEAVADDGISFAYIKSTEGGDWVDPRFTENWEGATAASLEVGAYHFFTLCRTGADQADNMLRTVPPDADLPPAVDLEFPMNCADRPEPDRVLAELRVFIDTVEMETGETVLLYVEDAFDAMYGVTAGFDNPTWVRSLRSRPDGDRWLVWQANDAADVDGVTGGVDLNLMSAECCAASSD